MKERLQPLQRPGPLTGLRESDAANARTTAHAVLTPEVGRAAAPAPQHQGALRAAGRAVVQLLHGILPERVVLPAANGLEELDAVRRHVRVDDPFRCAGCRREAEAAARLRIELAGPLAALEHDAEAPAELLPEPAEFAAQLSPASRSAWCSTSQWGQHVLVRETAEMLAQHWQAVEAVAHALHDRLRLAPLELLEIALPALLAAPRQLPDPLQLLLQCELEAAREAVRAEVRELAEDGTSAGSPLETDGLRRLEKVTRQLGAAELGALADPRCPPAASPGNDAD